MTTKTFLKCVDSSPVETDERNGNQEEVWIISSLSYVVWYLQVASYFPLDTNLDNENLYKRIFNNKWFLKIKSSS